MEIDVNLRIGCDHNQPKVGARSGDVSLFLRDGEIVAYVQSRIDLQLDSVTSDARLTHLARVDRRRSASHLDDEKSQNSM